MIITKEMQAIEEMLCAMYLDDDYKQNNIFSLLLPSGMSALWTSVIATFNMWLNMNNDRNNDSTNDILKDKISNNYYILTCKEMYCDTPRMLGHVSKIFMNAVIEQFDCSQDSGFGIGTPAEQLLSMN